MNSTDMQTGYGRTQVISRGELTVPDGVVAVLGHNGAGKTTLLRAAVGLLKPTRGQQSFSTARTSPGCARTSGSRAVMAYVPQGQQSFGQLTTAENLQLVADGRKNGKARIGGGAGPVPRTGQLLAPARRPALGRPAPAARDRPGADHRAAAADPRRAHRGHPAHRGRRDRGHHHRADPASGIRCCWSSSTSASPSRPPTATTCWPPAGSVPPGRAASNQRGRCVKQC